MEGQIHTIEEYVRDLRRYFDARMQQLESDIDRRERRQHVVTGIAIFVGIIIGVVIVFLWK
ncbi:MAG: hypothetical protein ABSA92_07155 [Candidatus Bathyarchaeia archaeon]